MVQNRLACVFLFTKRDRLDRSPWFRFWQIFVFSGCEERNEICRKEAHKLKKIDPIFCLLDSMKSFNWKKKMYSGKFLINLQRLTETDEQESWCIRCLMQASYVRHATAGCRDPGGFKTLLKLFSPVCKVNTTLKVTAIHGTASSVS